MPVQNRNFQRVLVSRMDISPGIEQRLYNLGFSIVSSEKQSPIKRLLSFS
jgi:Fe2+ transport system protein FeoA